MTEGGSPAQSLCGSLLLAAATTVLDDYLEVERLHSAPPTFDESRRIRCLSNAGAVVKESSRRYDAFRSMILEVEEPTVVDLSRPGQALSVEIGVSEASELLMSLCALSECGDPDVYELGRARLDEIRAQTPPELIASIDALLAGSEKLPAHLLGLVYETPQPRSIAGFLDKLADTEPLEIQLHLLGYYMRGHHLTEPETIRRAATGDQVARTQLLEAAAEWPGKHEAIARLFDLGAARMREQLLELLPAWNEHVFQPLAGEALPLMTRDAEAKRELARTLSPEQVVERTTNGLQYAPRPDVHRLVFFPTYWQRPWVLVGEYKHNRIYCYPITIDHAAEDEPSPAQLARMYKALGDEGRLRLLKRLQGGPLTLTEAAQELGLAKSTAHHHLAILRQAGLVLVRDDDEKLYTLRTTVLPRGGGLLQSYLQS
jgi:DNA-binding transcriptional ArsR family regulator